MRDGNELTETEQRHYWRLRWLSSLQAFTDATVQASRWIDADEANPHYSYVECMSCYFDDADLANHDSYAQRIVRGYLTIEEADAVTGFHQLAVQYRSPSEDDYDVDTILSDPDWRNVVEAAQRARGRLLLLITDTREMAALTKPLIWEKTGASFHASYPDFA